MRHFAVFGTHPRLSLAEFKAVRSDLATPPTLCGSAMVIEDPAWDGAFLMKQLGGTVKLGDIVAELPIQDVDGEALAKIIADHPRGERVVFGLTVFGGTAFHKQENKLALETKRALTTSGRSVRWVTSEGDAALSPAAVAKMHLTDEGYDFVLLVHEQTVLVGLTTHVQDADAWGLRDFGRPVRDDENGMLPPKLARMMVNLAGVDDGGTLFDPFCGSGTIQMEAALATKAKKIACSDSDAAQVSATKENLEWLFSKYILKRETEDRFQTFVSDARKISSQLKTSSVDVVVTEGYLGPALSGEETLQTLEKNAREIEKLWSETLAGLHPLMKKNGRIVGVWPSFKSSHGVARVEVGELTKLGYRLVNPLGDWDLTNAPLLYHRQGQRVMRRIVVLERI